MSERLITGIGGIFFKARDAKALAAWYRDHLGMPIEEWGGSLLFWKHDPDMANALTVWTPFPDDTDHFAPSEKPFMINFRVKDLQGVLAKLKTEGVHVLPDVQEGELGKFGWVMDPEGNKVELWQPPQGQ